MDIVSLCILLEHIDAILLYSYQESFKGHECHDHDYVKFYYGTKALEFYILIKNTQLHDNIQIIDIIQGEVKEPCHVWGYDINIIMRSLLETIELY